MSVVTPSSQDSQQRTLRRIWKAPSARSRWIWLAVSIVLFLVTLIWYIITLRTQASPGPLTDPLRLFGIGSFILVFGTVAYTLRRRFVRGLPGKVQSWLWMHTWIGIVTILMALMHENFDRVTYDFCQNFTCLTDTYWATSALFALIFLVVSGIAGRFLDLWQTHVIAHEASTNGVGIVRALEERIKELEYTIERLCAGKSEPFKQYCLLALQGNADFDPSPENIPPMPPTEHRDFQLAYSTIGKRVELEQSLKRQNRAQRVMQIWRTGHIILATIAVLIISYHGIMELLTNVFHIIPGGG